MKNLHLIPTEKPSRLVIDTIENKLYLQPILHKKTINVLPQHIDITSDEEIKEDLLILHKHWKYLRLYDCDAHALIVLDVIQKEKLFFYG